MSEDEAAEYVCRKCKEPVEFGARKCPHCGHNTAVRGGVHRAVVGWYSPAKWVCYLSIIGIPLGLWFRRKQKHHKKADESGIAVPADAA